MRILIIRLSAIGDAVMAAPLVAALRQHYPQAHLAWLTQPEIAGFLKTLPGLDEVIVWPRQRWSELRRQGAWIALTQAMWSFARDLRKRKFDWALDLQGLSKSAAFARLSGAARRVGINPREVAPWLLTERLRVRRDDPEISSEYRAMARYLGLPDESFRLHLPLAPQDLEEKARALTRMGIQSDYIAIAPFTTRPQKHWPEDHWPQALQALHEHTHLPVLMLGGPGDAEAARRLQSACSPSWLHNCVGQTRLTEAAALIAGAALVIGVDTGLTHMGMAAGRPTLALFGATRPYLHSGQPHTRVLYDALPCSPCRRRPNCGGRYPCMRGLTPARVTQAALELLPA